MWGRWRPELSLVFSLCFGVDRTEIDEVIDRKGKLRRLLTLLSQNWVFPTYSCQKIKVKKKYFVMTSRHTRHVGEYPLPLPTNCTPLICS